MRAPLPLGLLPALLATGSGLLCQVCRSPGEWCSGPLQPCAPWEGACVTLVVHFSLGANAFSYMAKSCLEPENCPSSTLTVTFGHNHTVQGSSACCQTDRCNAGAIPVPSVSPMPNGRQCPSCYAAGADHCEDKEPLACTGAEDHCVEFIGTLTLGELSLRKAAAGCGSPGACWKRVGVQRYAQGVVDVLSRAECYPAPQAGGEL